MTVADWRVSLIALAIMNVSACSEMGAIPNPLAMNSGRIHIETHAKSGNSQLLRNGRPIGLLLADVTDARPSAGSRKIGDIRTTVIDMADTSLVLDQDVAAAAARALREQLVADGFVVVSDAQRPHDFMIDARLKDFRLDVVDMDRISIIADIAVRDAQTHDVLWAGTVGESDQRFAGVAGDSRATIVSYLAKGVSAWAVKAGANTRDALLKSFPQSVAVSQLRELPPPQRVGVTTLQEAQSREPVAAPSAGVAVPTAAVPPAIGNSPIAAGTGMFAVTTMPSRAKVYVGDVYYGLSPLKLELPTGIAECRFELEGYKSATEKVSVRKGETTELELKLERR